MPKVAQLIIAEAPWAPHQGWSQPLVLQASPVVKSTSFKWKSSALLAVNPGQATKLQLSKTHLGVGVGVCVDGVTIKAKQLQRGGGAPTLREDLPSTLNYSFTHSHT